MVRLFLSVLAVFLVVVNHCEACCYDISRKGWGAMQAQGTTPFSTPTHVAIHHSATPACNTQSDCIARVQSIQNYHINTKGWDDIGYNFLIGGDGLVYEARGWNNQGAHVYGHNSYSVGICFIGDFTSSVPSDAMLDAAKDLIQCGKDMGELSSSATILGHQQFSGQSTSCPANIVTYIPWRFQ